MDPFSVASFALGVGSSLLGSSKAKKMAKKQAALARAQAERIREQAAQARARMERELESLRTMRSLDVPAFQQAAQQAYLSASKASERVARARTMGRMGDEVREAVFGGQFDRYVGGRLAEFQRNADLTQRIFQGAQQIERMTLESENQAAQLGYAGQAKAIEMEAAAGDPLANIMGVASQALGQFASAKSAKAQEAADKQGDFMQQALLSDLDATELLAKKEALQKGGFADFFSEL